ncbi:hypothetical protein QLG02_15265 [Aeromonas sp. V90_14]|uniref:hypothetical protein n=1 Tax=Aeromonas sp. V90_14 TaxID=3044241 RepID=UPI00249F0546|nr:hypothetical protein [Aeromonas sp. V90_14]MDI3431696.1 hypothetical protein [Aeromonas sp. V90_14]
MTEEKTLLLLPRWFFKRQLIVSLCLFVAFPVAMTLITPQKNHVPVVSWLIITVEFLVLGMLYPYSRYAVQRIIDYWYGDENVVYDASIKSSFDRKFAKLMVSLVCLLVLGPMCLIVLLVKRWRERRGQITREPASG